MNTYTEYQNEQASEKVGLVALDLGKRLMGWSVYSGTIYSVSFQHDVITQLQQDGTALTAVASIAAITTGTYYLDRSSETLYLRASDSANPNSKFIACSLRLFFSNVPVRKSWDLSTGFDVDWKPLLRSTSQFGVGLDNTNLLGFAIEGSGNVSFYNDRAFWAGIYDKYFFEGQQCYVYSWNRTLPITEAKLIYKGRVDSKTFTNQSVTLNLKDQLVSLRSKLSIPLMEDVAGAKIPGSLNTARQRYLFGYVKGNRPTNIDQMLDLTGYTITGTAATTNASVSVTGTGTAFLSQLTPGDEVLFGSDTIAYTVATVDTNTALTLTEAYESATGSALAIRLKKTDNPKRYMNRIFLVAGHQLKEPSSTVTKIFSFTTFELSSATDFIAGEPVVINGENLVIERVSGNKITLTQSAAFISVGDTVTIPSVRNVYLNNRLLTNISDYTYSASTAKITLNQLAEFNTAQVRSLTGTLTFTHTGTDIQKRTVTGSGTSFKEELAPGDWIRRSTESDWFEILSVESNTSLTLRTVSTYTSTGASLNKKPEVYKQGTSVLSCDVLGLTENGTPTGVFVNNAPRVVKYLLTAVGLSSLIDTASFTEVDSVSTPYLGFAIPKNFSETAVPVVRDIINTVNQSVFGSLYQTNDFQLAYSILSPRRPPSMQIFRESDLLEWAIKSNSANITKSVSVEYLDKEYDVAAGEPSKQISTSTSNAVDYFTDIQKEKIFSTYLISRADADLYAKRWSFILENSNGTLEIKLALQGARLDINESIHVQHEKLCERFGSGLSRRVGAVSSIVRDISRSQVELDDVGGSFSRCATIAATTSAEYSAAEDNEKFINGYITDAYGMIDNDAETFGINLIW